MAEIFGISEPTPAEVATLGDAVANLGIAPFDHGQLWAIARAFRYMQTLAPANGLDKEAFVVSALHFCDQTRDRLPLTLVVLQERYVDGFEKVANHD